MDEVGARIQQQSSIASETNNEECTKVECKYEREFIEIEAELAVRRNGFGVS